MAPALSVLVFPACQRIKNGAQHDHGQYFDFYEHDTPDF